MTDSRGIHPVIDYDGDQDDRIGTGRTGWQRAGRRQDKAVPRERWAVPTVRAFQDLGMHC